MNLRKWALMVGAFATLTMSAAHAQEGYPSKAIRLVVPLGPGSGFDVNSRFFAKLMSEKIGQSVWVDNKPGADTGIGVRDVLNAPADGYTMLALTGTSVVLNPLLYKKLIYNEKEVKPVAGLFKTSAVYVTPVNSPYKTLDDLIKAAKANPGAVSFANYGGIYRAAMQRLEELHGVTFNSIRYRGMAQLSSDLIGGQVDASLLETGGVAPLIKGGKVRALAVTTDKPMANLPGVPTAAEAGYPDLELYAWTGVAVSVKTPPEIVKKLQDASLEVAESEEFKRYVLDKSADLMPLNSEEMDKRIAEETVMYRGVYPQPIYD